MSSKSLLNTHSFSEIIKVGAPNTAGYRYVIIVNFPEVFMVFGRVSEEMWKENKSTYYQT